MKNTSTLTLPDQLSEQRMALESAVEVLQPKVWPEGTKRLEATQASLIAKALIPRLHKDVKRARVGYLFREKMQGRGMVKLATAKKASADLEYFAELDFVIDFNHEAWLQLTPIAKIALVDHELAHLGVGDDGGFCLVPHDIEEFCAIVGRWGLWRPSLVTFGHVCSQQVEIFEAVGT